jgi:WD40 repeat protein
VVNHRTIILWSAEDGQKIATFQTDRSLEYAAFSPDGKTLAVVDSEGIALWDVASRRKKATLRTDRGKRYERIAFLPNGNTLAVGSTLWSAEDGRKIATLQEHYGLEDAAFSPDGKTLAERGENEVTLWDVASNQRTSTVWTGTGSEPSCMAFSPDGRAIHVGGKGSVRSLDTLISGKKEEIHFANAGVSSGRPAFSPDGRTLATVRVLPRGEIEVVLWDVAGDKENLTLVEQVDGYLLNKGEQVDGDLEVAFSPDGKTLALRTYHGQIALWDVADGRKTATLSPGYTVSCMAFSSDSRVLAAGLARSDDGQQGGEIQVWDLPR